MISDQERDTALAAAQAGRANIEADEAAAANRAKSRIHKGQVSHRRRGRNCDCTSGRSGRSSTGTLTTVSQVDPIKAIVTAGEGPFTDFVSRHPDPTERATYIRGLQFDLVLSNESVYPHKGKFYALDRNLDPETGSIRYEVTFPNPGGISSARTVRESAFRQLT